MTHHHWNCSLTLFSFLFLQLPIFFFFFSNQDTQLEPVYLNMMIFFHVHPAEKYGAHTSYFLSRYPIHPAKDFPAPTGGWWMDMMFGLCKAASLADTVAHTLVRPAAFQTSCLEFKSCCSVCLFLSVQRPKQLAVWRFPDCLICTFTLKLSFPKCLFLIQSQFTLLGIQIVLLRN